MMMESAAEAARRGAGPEVGGANAPAAAVRTLPALEAKDDRRSFISIMCSISSTWY